MMAARSSSSSSSSPSSSPAALLRVALLGVFCVLLCSGMAGATPTTPTDAASTELRRESAGAGYAMDMGVPIVDSFFVDFAKDGHSNFRALHGEDGLATVAPTSAPTAAPSAAPTVFATPAVTSGAESSWKSSRSAAAAFGIFSTVIAAAVGAASLAMA